MKSFCRTCWRTALVAWIACGAVATVARAEQNPARFVPADAAAIVLFSNIAKSNTQFTKFIQGSKPDFGGVDLAELEMSIGFVPGTIDLARPIIVIADRPNDLSRLIEGDGLTEADPNWPVIGFFPADPEQFDRMTHASDAKRGGRRIRRVVGTYGRYRLLMRDGIAFVAPKTTMLARIARTPENASAWSRMTDAARDDADRSDVFVRLSMGEWRATLESKFRAITQMMKLGVMMQQSDPARLDETQKLASWFFDGVVDGILQMQTFSAALSFENEYFRLSHHHEFRKGAWLADYLGQVSRTENLDRWRAFPDRPFMFGASVNWHVPADSCLSVRFNRKCMSDPVLCRKVSKRERVKIDRDMRELMACISGEEFIVTSDVGRLMPLRVYGAYTVKDAPRTLKIQRRVRESSSEFMGSLFPGISEIGKKMRRVVSDGLVVYELPMMSDALNPMMRANISAVYGTDAMYQEAAPNETTIIYAISGPGGVKAQADVVRGGARNLSQNRRIRDAHAAMPADANVYLLIDVRRMAITIPRLIQSSMRAANGAEGSSDDAVAPESVGPLLGWSVTVRGNHVDGEFVMNADDLRLAIDAVAKVGREVRRGSGGGIQPNPGYAADRPVPFCTDY